MVIQGPGVEQFLLTRIGFGQDVLRQAVTAGMAELALVTENSAAATAGFRLWDGTLVSLRQQLKPKRWSTERPGQLEVVRRNDNRIQIAATLGDDATGDPEVSPTFKHEKGVATDRAIEDNQRSLADLAPDDQAWGNIETWWLLYKPASKDGEAIVRVELSLPVSIEGARVTAWGYRVILDEVPVGASKPVVIPDAAPTPAVSVVRRQTA